MNPPIKQDPTSSRAASEPTTNAKRRKIGDALDPEIEYQSLFKSDDTPFFELPTLPETDPKSILKTSRTSPTTTF